MVVLAVLFGQGCASVNSKEAEALSRVYRENYDAVWAAVEEYILDDVQCVPKKVSKKRGYLETEWVHRFDTDGLVRWQIRAAVTKSKGGVRVCLEKRVQMRDEVSQQITRFKQEKNAPSNNSGWAKSYFDTDAIAEYYDSIEAKLGR